MASSASPRRAIKAVNIGTYVIYRELLKKIVEFFKTGKSPVDLDDGGDHGVHRGREQERRQPRCW